MLYINRPEPGEGLSVMQELRKGILEFLSEQPMAGSFLIELTKNILDHADQGHVFMMKGYDGRISFHCISYALAGISEDERNMRRGEPNRSVGMQTITDLALEPKYCILDGFQAYRLLLVDSPGKRYLHFFSGRFKPLDG